MHVCVYTVSHDGEMCKMLRSDPEVERTMEDAHFEGRCFHPNQLGRPNWRQKKAITVILVYLRFVDQ